MNDAVLETARCALSSRKATLAEAWIESLHHADGGFVDAGDICRHVVILADSAIDALCADVFDSAIANAIGVALANLSSAPRLLHAVLDSFMREMTAGLDGAHILALLPRLTAFQHAFAEGFIHTAQQHAGDGYIRAVADALPILLFALNRDGVFTLAVGKALETLALTSDDLIGHSIDEIAAIAPEVRAYFDAALAGETFTAMVEGRGRPFETRYAPQRAGDTIIGVIGVALDVTERTQLLEEVLQWRQQTIAHARPPRAPQPLQQGSGSRGQGSGMIGQHNAVPDRHTGSTVLPAAIDPTAMQAIDGLTPQERELVQLLVGGATNRQIALVFSVGEKAIEKRLAKLYAKLEVATRVEVVTLAVRAGLG
jgi:DNA-binding CsgD family transcriptional regulator/PAS domain-containing protein